MSGSDITTPALKVCRTCGRSLPETTSFFRLTRAKTLLSDCRGCEKVDRQQRLAEKRRRYDAGLVVIPAEKQCTLCNETKPSSEFGKRAISDDGLTHRCKSCLATLRRSQYVRNPSVFLEPSKKWAAKNRAKVAEYQRRYRDKHREARRARARELYTIHRSILRKRKRLWIKAHPECNRAYRHRRRGRLAEVGGVLTPDDVRQQYERQKGKCFYCHKKLTDYHIEHVIPIALGGSNGPENVVIACPECNLRKGSKHPMDFCGRLL